MSEELAGAGFGQPHEVFDLQVVVQFGLVVGGEGGCFLALDEIPDALAGRLGRLEVNQLPGTQRGDELNQLFVWFHTARFASGKRPDQRVVYAPCGRCGRRVPHLSGNRIKPPLMADYWSCPRSVMVGSAFAHAKEAPGRGNHWGMATPHANLPRGTRIKMGVTGSLKQILFGPATVDDGSQKLVGAITTCMGNVGAANIREFQETEIIIASSIKTEGKLFQTVQSVGMGTR